MGNTASKANDTDSDVEQHAAGVVSTPGPAPARSDVEELAPNTRGRWLVTTRGSRHVFDLEARTYRRHPLPGHGRFPYDGQAVALTRVERWPRAGRQLAAMGQQGTQVVAIERRVRVAWAAELRTHPMLGRATRRCPTLERTKGPVGLRALHDCYPHVCSDHNSQVPPAWRNW